MTFKRPHVDCLRRLAVTSAALLRNSLVNSNKHVPIIKHWAPLVIHCDAGTCQMTGEAFGGEACVWRATEDQQTHDWLPFHVSHLSSRSFMPPPPPTPGGGRSPPLPLSRPRAELFLTSLLALRRKSPVHSLAPQLMPTPLSSHKQLWTACFCVNRSTFWGSMVWFLCSISGRDSDLLQKTKKLNQIKYTVSIGICTQLHIVASFTNLLSIFWTKHVLGIIQMKDA